MSNLGAQQKEAFSVYPSIIGVAYHKRSVHVTEHCIQYKHAITTLQIP